MWYISRHSRKKVKKVRLRWVLKGIGRCFAVLGVTALGGVLCAFGAITVVCKGPSPSARDLLVTTMMETSAAKFIPRLYFSEAEIQNILQKNTVVEGEAQTEAPESFAPPETEMPKDTIEVFDVTGSTYMGKMMVVHDPSRVKVASIETFGPEVRGLRVEEFAKKYNAVAAVNGGAFQDTNGVGKGGQPLGLIIRDGKFLLGNASTRVSIIAFDQENRLLVGRMTGQEAMDRGVRDAVSFGPAFIINGEPLEVSGSGGGLNPRTVIGQRADGAVLLLVIDGRQAHSLGATYKDCIQVMMDYKAINAANLDGGSSTIMVYQGEVLNSCASMYGSRAIPTAIIVE